MLSHVRWEYPRRRRGGSGQRVSRAREPGARAAAHARQENHVERDPARGDLARGRSQKNAVAHARRRLTEDDAITLSEQRRGPFDARGVSGWRVNRKRLALNLRERVNDLWWHPQCVGLRARRVRFCGEVARTPPQRLTVILERLEDAYGPRCPAGDRHRRPETSQADCSGTLADPRSRGCQRSDLSAIAAHAAIQADF